VSPEAQRIAIAEVTGLWKDCHIVKGQHGDHDMPMGKPQLIDGTFSDEFEVVDNYLNDLNAMHAAEKVLTTTAQQNRYYSEISDITWGNPETGYRQVVFNQLTATAAQRAEAFLRALNLWQESPPTTP
jgi:hypothetical protein